jgi:hypothetical protein
MNRSGRIGTMLAGAAGVIAAPAVGGLAWRTARQRQAAKALEITTPNGVVEQRFAKVGGIDQWIQLRARTARTRCYWSCTAGRGWPNAVFTCPATLGAALHRHPVGPPRGGQDPGPQRQGRQRPDDRRVADAIELIESCASTWAPTRWSCWPNPWAR